ncbi:MAG: Nif3-like dinuclear metal center hexameric protein [Bacteroidota bacterium]
MVRIRDIISTLEQVAPLAYQESYDNAGLVVGDPETPVDKLLICLDVTDDILEEAKAGNCQLIIAHHPLIFKPIRQLSVHNRVERCLIRAIHNNIAIYVIHTNLDNVAQGVNKRLAHLLGLHAPTILSPKAGMRLKLTTFVPPSALKKVTEALHEAGAGQLGNYTHCSFVSTGTGSFKPSLDARPYLGAPGQPETVQEHRVEVTFPSHRSTAIIQALQQAHPYEEVAYDIQKLENTCSDIGLGMVGMLPQPLATPAFLQHIKTCMHVPYLRHSRPIQRPIQRVAVCGGSGSTLLPVALLQQADALITADVKYHDFFEADDRLLLVDIGHYESEVATIDLLYHLLSEKFVSIVLTKCQTVTNPVYYA